MGLGISFICSAVYTFLLDSRYKAAFDVNAKVVISILFVAGFVSFVLFRILSMVIGSGSNKSSAQTQVREEFIEKNKQNNSGHNQNKQHQNQKKQQ